MREGVLGKETWGPTSTSQSEYPLPIKHGNRNSCVLDDVPSFIHLRLQWISHSCPIIFSQFSHISMMFPFIHHLQDFHLPWMTGGQLSGILSLSIGSVLGLTAAYQSCVLWRRGDGLETSSKIPSNPMVYASLCWLIITTNITNMGLKNRLPMITPKFDDHHLTHQNSHFQSRVRLVTAHAVIRNPAQYSLSVFQ